MRVQRNPWLVTRWLTFVLVPYSERLGQLQPHEERELGVVVEGHPGDQRVSKRFNHAVTAVSWGNREKCSNAGDKRIQHGCVLI